MSTATQSEFRCVALVAASLVAGAGWGQGLQPLPDVPPPPRLSATPLPADEDAPTITIKQGENGAKLEEFRTKTGRLYAVRVTPSIGKPYLLIDPDGHGVLSNMTEIPAGEINAGVHPAQWTLFEW